MYTKYTGIILKKHPFGEADELLTIYTRQAGKLRCKVVSARKPASKLAGFLSSLNEIEFETAGRNLPVLISVRALSINHYIRQNLRKFAFALVGIETLYRLTADRQENEIAYEKLREFLRNLGESSDENLEVRKFQLDLLAASGYAFSQSVFRHPEGTPEESHEILRPSTGLRMTNKGGLSFRGNPRNLRDSSQSTAQNDKLFLTPELERAIDKHIAYVLEREIKSAKMLDTLI